MYDIKHRQPVHAALQMLRFACVACLALAAFAPGAGALEAPGEIIGSGDGRIHIIPTLSKASVKNGEVLAVQAIVLAEAGVASVEVVIERESPANPLAVMEGSLKNLLGMPVAQFSLIPASTNFGGVNELATFGMWHAEWTADGLEEAWYRVTITVTDRDGHQYSDASLRFSDPIAGIDAVGTTVYPNGGMRRMDEVSGGLEFPENQLLSAVIDPDNGYAYFGTNTSPGRVVKVALGNGTAPPTRVGAVTLDAGENILRSAVIDTGEGYAYFGTSTAPGRVVKVALGAGSAPPTRVGAVTFDTGENQLWSGVIDPANGYAYFGTDTTPGRVVKVALGTGAAPPTRVDAVSLEPGENLLRSAVIDPVNGYAYFGTNTSPGQVVKVGLGAGAAPPTRVGAVTLDPEDSLLRSGVIDPDNGYAYFGTNTSPGRVVKVALGLGAAPPTRVDAVTLDSGENQLWSAGIDPANGYAYFGTNTSPGQVVKVALGVGSAPPTRAGAVTVDFGENQLWTTAIDPVNGNAYFGTSTSPGMVVKVALGAGAAAPARLAALALNPGENQLRSAVVDRANGFAYFGTDTSPGSVVKVALGQGGAPPARVGAVTLDTGENLLRSAVIDPANGYAYFGTNNSPGRIVKVALGDGAAPPTRVGAVTLEPGENQLRSAVIDAANGYAYFGSDTTPGRVVKVALGEDDDPPTRVGAATLEAGEGLLWCAVIDTENGYAYFGTNTSPGRVVKVALGEDDDPPARVGAVILDAGDDQLRSAVIDTASGHAYFGTNTSPGRVVKVALGEDDDPPTRVGAVTFAGGENLLRSAVIDFESGHAFFGTWTSPGRVVKVALGDDAALPTRVGGVVLGAGENQLWSEVIDPANGYAYFGTNTTPGRVVRVALSQFGFVKGTRLTMPELGIVSDVSFYSHLDAGNLRLGLYSSGATPELLWESSSIANTADNDWLSVPISGGTPNALVLPAGDYWLAWQVNTKAHVPSYAPGNPGDGFLVPTPFGAFPATLDASTPAEPVLTDEVWSAFIVYDDPTVSPPNAITITPSTTGPTSATNIDFTVQFDEPVQNFDDEADLIIVHNGTANTGANIHGGPAVYTVTVEGISGDGSFTLAVSTTSNVQDLAGNPLDSSVTSAPVLVDNTPPNATVITPSTVGATNAASIDFTVAFDEPVQNFDDEADLIIVHDGTTNTGASINGGPNVYTVTVEGISGDGSFTLAVNTTSNVQDLAGNPLDSSVISTPVLIDTTPPFVDIGQPSIPITNTGPVEFTVFYTGAETILLSDMEVSLLTTGTAAAEAAVAPHGANSRRVEVFGITGDGTIAIVVAAGSAVDAAGNGADAAGPSEAFTVDNTPPNPPVILTNGGADIETAVPVITLSGTTDADTEILRMNGAPVPGYTAGDTVWSVQIDGLAKQLVQTYLFTAEDAVGNESEPSSITVTFTSIFVAPSVPMSAWPVAGALALVALVSVSRHRRE